MPVFDLVTEHADDVMNKQFGYTRHPRVGIKWSGRSRPDYRAKRVNLPYAYADAKKGDRVGFGTARLTLPSPVNAMALPTQFSCV